MRCAVCGKPCVVDEAAFYEGYPLESWKSLHPGKPWRPLRSWMITAPVYFKATADGTGCEVPFCGRRACYIGTNRAALYDGRAAELLIVSMPQGRGAAHDGWPAVSSLARR